MYYLNRNFRTVVFVADDGINTEADLERYLASLDVMLADYRNMGARAVLIADTRCSRKTPTPQQRARLGGWLSANTAVVQQVALGSVFIIRSALMRGALTALGWVGVLPPNLTVVGTFEEAIARAETLLTSAGLPLHHDLTREDAEERALGPLASRQSDNATAARS